MFYWILIILGAVAAIVGTGLWKKEPAGTKRKKTYAWTAYLSFVIYLLGIIGQFESVLSQIQPLLFVWLIAVPIIMLAIVFFERKKDK